MAADTDLTNIAHDYGLADLAPICRGDPPLPDPAPPEFSSAVSIRPVEGHADIQ